MTNDPLSLTFAALADPTRRAILLRLAEGEATVNEVAEPFEISLQAVSKIHHLAWWAEDFEGAMARAKATGWTVVQDGGEGGTRFAYFDAGGVTSTVIELSELTDGTRAFNDMVAAAAADWDGITDPVRPVVF